MIVQLRLNTDDANVGSFTITNIGLAFRQC
jgi:hypothetical protein